MRTREYLRDILQTIMEHRWRFLAGFLTVFFFSLFLLASLGFVPNDLLPPRADMEAPERTANVAVEEIPDPIRVRIPALGTDVRVVNPKSRDVAVLDRALTEGAVRYPGSGTLAEEDANVFLFGHSSYLPVVRNKAFQAFNDLAKLSKGDEIVVESNARAYRYRVVSLRLARADEALVDLSHGERRLTLSTCNSFGKPSERFVVEAVYESSEPLGF